MNTLVEKYKWSLITLAVVVSAFLLGQMNSCKNPVVQHEIESIHDTSLKVVPVHDTIYTPRSERDTVWGHRLNDSPCPDFSFFSIQGGDSVWGVASCLQQAVFHLTVGHLPIYRTHFDTLWKIHEVEKEKTVVKEHDPISLTGYGEYRAISSSYGGGIQASFTWQNISLYGGPSFHTSQGFELVAGVSVNLLRP